MAVEILVTNEGKLDCHTCDDKLKEERGHDKDGIIPFMVGEKRVFRCPLTFITSISWEYIKAFSFYPLLPNGEGWNNESNKFIQAIMVLRNEYQKWEEKEYKRKSK